MYLLTLHNGKRALYAGRSSEQCFLVKMQGERYWWWLPQDLVASALEIPQAGKKTAA